MAALLARAARGAHAAARVARLRHTCTRASLAPTGVGHSLAWRGSQASTAFASHFSTAKARTPFSRLVAAYTSAIERLADRGELDLVLRAVYECYKPLYEAHPLLQGKRCLLWDACDDAASILAKPLPSSLEKYNDALTQIAEVKAMEVLLGSTRPEMAAAVCSHRTTLATTLGNITDDKSGSMICFSAHREKFKPLAKRALLEAGKSDEAKAVAAQFVSSSKKGGKSALRKHGEKTIRGTTQRAGTKAADHTSRVHADTSADAGSVPVVLSEEDKRVKAYWHALRQRKVWIRERAQQGDFDRLLREVYECYRPLYDQQLHGLACSLWDACADAPTAAQTEPWMRLHEYNDQTTRHVEVNVAVQCSLRNRPDLVVALYNHRMALATAAGTTVTHDDTSAVIDFAKHLTHFFVKTMHALRTLGDYGGVLRVYETACAAKGGLPPPEVVTALVMSLRASGDHSAVRTLYEDIKRANWSMDDPFYRQMLYFAGSVRDAALMTEIRAVMKAKNMRLRHDEYFVAICSFGNAAVGLDAAADDSAREPEAAVVESYQACLVRLAQQRASPTVLEASKQVLSLFDEVLDVAKTKSPFRTVFAHVLRAALVVEEYDRVPQCVQLYERYVGQPITDAQVLGEVVNGFLLRDDPVAAWELVVKSCEATPRDREQPPCTESNAMLVPLTSIMQYLETRHDIERTRQFLEALKAKPLLALFADDQHRRLIDSVVSSTTHESDAAIVEMLNEYAAAFRVTDKPSSLEALANACMVSGRWSLLDRVLSIRDLTQIPWLPASLAVRISESALADESSQERMELVTRMLRVVDLASLRDADRTTLNANAARATHVLRGNAKSGRE